MLKVDPSLDTGVLKALIRSVEGKMGEPRQRTPYPVQRGIDGRPTAINNVETWYNIAPIVMKGPAWFTETGSAKSAGTKVFSLVGKVNRTGLVEMPLGTPLKTFVYGIGGVTGAFTQMGIPAAHLSAYLATFAEFFGGIALLATAVGEERIPVAGWAGIVISFAGFLLVVTGENGGLAFTWEAWRGAVLILLANACWAGYTVFSKPVLDRNAPFRLAAVGTIAGTAVYLPFAVRDLAAVEWARIPLQAWGAILYSGLVAIFLCFVIWYASVKEVGSAKTGVYSNLTPILAIFFAGLVLGERLSALQAVGAAITLAGVYLTRSGYRFFERKVEPQPETDTNGRSL